MNRAFWLVFATGVLLFVVTFSGCAGRGWRMKVVDTGGNPIPGAHVSIWAYFPSPSNPYYEGDRICREVRDGILEPLGWHYITDYKGVAQSMAFPTGGPVIDNFTPGYSITSYSSGSVWGTIYGSNGTNASITAQASDTTTTYVPPQLSMRFVPGNWLAVSVYAPGYLPQFIVFRPDRPNGDFGTVKLIKMIQPPATDSTTQVTHSQVKHKDAARIEEQTGDETPAKRNARIVIDSN